MSPPKDGTVFLAYNANQNTFQIAWFNTLNRHFKYTGGEYYGSETNPMFTHWCSLPTVI